MPRPAPQAAPGAPNAPGGFPDALRALRLSRGLTQAQAGQIIGVTTQTISNWECGRHAAQPKNQKKVLEHLHVTDDDFL